MLDTLGVISYEIVAVSLSWILFLLILTIKVIGVGIISTGISFVSLLFSLSLTSTVILYLPCFVNLFLLVILALLESITPSV